LTQRPRAGVFAQHFHRNLSDAALGGSLGDRSRQLRRHAVRRSPQRELGGVRGIWQPHEAADAIRSDNQ
jgi:hypothetical protein